jgi:hypothetical protein
VTGFDTLANVARLPTITGVGEYVEAGSLMSYGANLTDLFRRADDFVGDDCDQGILPGACFRASISSFRSPRNCISPAAKPLQTR